MLHLMLKYKYQVVTIQHANPYLNINNKGIHISHKITVHIIISIKKQFKEKS